MATTITANGINFPDGSAGSPSIGGTDTNTGLFTGSDIVGFATGGSERLRIDASGNVNIANDSGQLRLGTDADLLVYHNGSDSYVKNSTGDLYIRDTNGNIFIQPKTDENGIKCIADGAVELYHDNAKKLETWAGGIKLNGVENAGSQILVGASGDFAIEHDGSNTYLANSTGDLVLQNDANVKITAKAGGTQRFRFDSDGLKFGTDTAASNALYDYEEGTFNPTVTQGGSVSSYGTQIGFYIKIGRLVYWQIYMAITGTANGNGLIIGNFPFTSSTYNAHGYGGATMGYAANTFQTDNMYMYMEQNSTNLTFRTHSGAVIAGNSGNIFGNADFILFGSYTAAS